MLTDPSVLERICVLAEIAVPASHEYNDRKFVLKENIGTGYIQKIDLGPSLHIMISQYKLKKERLL